MSHYLAHIRKDTGGAPLWSQTAEEHCRGTAQYAAAALEPARLSASGYLAGLIHDAGKFTCRFQNYMMDEHGIRGSVNHTFAGVRLLFERYWKQDADDYSDTVCELLAVAAGSHHGLFDCVDERRQNGLRHRLSKEDIDYDEAVNGFFAHCAAPEELDCLFCAAWEEMSPVLEHICDMTDDNVSADQYETETAFYAGLLARLMLSGVIEGDRRDTAFFLNGAQFPEARDTDALKRMWAQCLDRVEEKLDQLPCASDIDRARWAISDRCGQAAQRPGGIFRLNVPTGGGKTLSSLRYALAHSARYGKQRVIFTSPLLSILEQNAAVIRDYVQDDSLILEHHSNLIHTEEEEQQLDERELLAETWDAPIIITTLVQLLNTLFSGKTAAIRRFHALCGSVIVIDEVQTVPRKMLSLFSLAVNFLVEVGGATVVLCSATQPCMERIDHPMHTPILDLVPYDPALWAIFRRTAIQNAGSMPLEQIAQFAVEQLECQDSLLIVCNKKSEADCLLRLLAGRGYDLFHLSAAMCVQHRRDTLEQLRASLAEADRKTICVATQVIEAGVDISFACVVRLCAGMDSVVQAAGRCNRNGEAGPGFLAPVYLVECAGESLTRLPDIQAGKDASLELLAELDRSPERYGGSMDSGQSIEYYYRALYRQTPKRHHDYCLKDRPSLLSLLARNERFIDDPPEQFYFRQAFRLAGSLFEVFDQDTMDVIVPYGAGAELITQLCGGRAEHDAAYLQELLEKAKPYTISLYRYQIDRLNDEHDLIPLQGGALGLSGHYSGESGFSLGETNLDFLEV